LHTSGGFSRASFPREVLPAERLVSTASLAGRVYLKEHLRIREKYALQKVLLLRFSQRGAPDHLEHPKNPRKNLRCGNRELLSREQRAKANPGGRHVKNIQVRNKFKINVIRKY
jgi:hypothetical protein